MGKTDQNRLSAIISHWPRALFLFFLVFCAAASASAQKPMTNDDVIQLVKGGIQESIILEAMDGQPAKFDISAQALVNLKQQGVSEKIILRMMAIATGSRNASAPANSPSEGQPARVPPKLSAGVAKTDSASGTATAAANLPPKASPSSSPSPTLSSVTESKTNAGTAAPAPTPPTNLPSGGLPTGIPPEIAAQIAAMQSGAGKGASTLNPSTNLPPGSLPAGIPPELAAQIAAMQSGAGKGAPGFNGPKNLSPGGLPAGMPPTPGADIASAKSGGDSRVSITPPRSVAYFTTDFSSTEVSLDNGSPSPITEGTLRVGSGRLRFERVTPSGTAVTIVNPQAMMGSVAAPGKPAEIVKKFDGVVGIPGNSGLSKFFLPLNPDNPCARYKSVVSCKPIGSEVVNGRQTTKWEFTHGIGGREWQTYEWIDPKLHVAVKRQFENHITELRDIREAPQPGKLFDIPSVPNGSKQ